MLQANTLLRESDSSSPFEDYSIFMYRQSAPEFGDRVKELERKLMYPVSWRSLSVVWPSFLKQNYPTCSAVVNNFNIVFLLCEY